MCIINQPAEVRNTEIFVSPDFENKRQLVIYSNIVKTNAQNNAMILPVPHPQTIKLHDLSHYKDIFKDCDRCFFSGMWTGRGLTNESYSTLRSNNTLEVYRCGSYDVSIVPNYNYFNRLNSNHFQLNPLVGEILRKYYDNNFGYIVCNLRMGSEEKYHPLGYSHQIYKNNLMFVPTRHHHSTLEESHSYYDHNIYSINTKPLCGSEKWNYQFKVKTDLISNFAFPEILCFNKLTIKATEPNTDLYFYLDNYIEPYGQYHGIDGCIFKTNHPEITFKNRGSIYIQVFYRGLPFLDESTNQLNFDKKGIAFAGTGTTFAVNGNTIIVTDDIGTNTEHQLEFKFNPYNNDLNQAVHLSRGNLI